MDFQQVNSPLTVTVKFIYARVREPGTQMKTTTMVFTEVPYLAHSTFNLNFNSTGIASVESSSVGIGASSSFLVVRRAAVSEDIA